ncbi:unnamed protein product [Linum tenue]|uniref:Uncharacterized protein n=1 Tax=Linum tenue TaxID=586396 RepID=A0AAV0KPS4_9ROSI|nr:unnamed protein product [Linum tenue]
MSADEDAADAVLSDVEEEDDPIPIAIPSPSQEDVSVERFRELAGELERERALRQAAEDSKSELQDKFLRLKSLAHEAIKKRDECAKQRDLAAKEKEEALEAKGKIAEELNQTKKLQDEVMKQRDEFARQLDEAVKARDGFQSEMENSRHMLVSGIEKISGKVSSFKNFAAAGLPRSQKYSGFPAVAYGVIKRTNEIVEELVRQIDATTKSRNEAREQMEQRNYEIAIEVSQLEATIGRLREELEKKSSSVESLEKSVADNHEKLLEVERQLSEKTQMDEKQAAETRQLVSEYDEKLRKLETEMESLRPLLVDQLNLVAQIHDQLYDVIKIVDSNHSDSDLSESLFLPQQTDMGENLRASVAGMESIHELTRIVLEKAKDWTAEKIHEVKKLNETVDQLNKEKEQISSLLRSALSKRMASDPASRTNELFQAAENGLRDSGIDFKFNKVLVASQDSNGPPNTDEDEIYTLAGALENIVKASQLEIIELQHSVEELRAESSLLKEHIEGQAKELAYRLQRIQELEEKERVANESVEGLMLDIAAAEEEITRWKVAAEEEAAAGRTVEQEVMAQLSVLKQELEEARQSMSESEQKLKSKEETVAAAMAAREAAEKSLRLADTRASRLRDRVEELSRLLEEFETREDSRGRNGSRYVCWPWQWLGLDFVGTTTRPEMQQQQQTSNEMELSEPFL